MVRALSDWPLTAAPSIAGYARACRRPAGRSSSVHRQDALPRRQIRLTRRGGRRDSEPAPRAQAVHGQYVSGSTGCGKTWLGCALAHQAARIGFSVLYVRAGRLFDELHVAHGDGSFARRLTQLTKLDLLVIDDFAISPMGAPERNDLLEVLDDRVGTRSTLITSQLKCCAQHFSCNAESILTRSPAAETPHSLHS